MSTLTVFTPAYNRAYSINLCYESLCRQTSMDFIWMVIDDGSTDNTKELIKEWQKEQNNFEIIYIYKENGGMHTAHNTAYENITTPINVCVDSDDYMPDNAVEIIISCWNTIKNDNNVSGIIALDYFSNGSVIGKPLPNNIEFTTLTNYYKNGGEGDKKLIYRTDVMKEFPPYPVFKGEKYVGLAYKYYLADQKYKLKILNFPVCIVEYMPDGSTSNMLYQYKNNPKGFAFLRKECMKLSSSKSDIFKNCIHYVSSSFISKNTHFIKESPKKLLTVLAIPFGFALYLYIKIKTRK